VYKIRNTRNASLADICPAPAGLSLFPAAQILLVCIAAKVLTHAIYMPACTYLWRKKQLKSNPPRLVFLQKSLKINSAIGLRQMLPWQTNMIFIIARL